MPANGRASLVAAATTRIVLLFALRLLSITRSRRSKEAPVRATTSPCQSIGSRTAFALLVIFVVWQVRRRRLATPCNLVDICSSKLLVDSRREAAAEAVVEPTAPVANECNSTAQLRTSKAFESRTSNDGWREWAAGNVRTHGRRRRTTQSRRRCRVTSTAGNGVTWTAVPSLSVVGLGELAITGRRSMCARALAFVLAHV